jgi:hypothetical protein
MVRLMTENGDHETAVRRIDALIDRLADYLDGVGPEWGGMHVVMADGNWADEHLQALVHNPPQLYDDGMPTGIIDTEAAVLASILLGYSIENRKMLRDEAERRVREAQTPKPCVQIECPPMEEFEINAIIPYHGEIVAGSAFGDHVHEDGTVHAEPGKWVELDGGALDMGAIHLDGQEWAHTHVAASYPAGTDPLAAIREAMGVFMERRDGTNAMEWWQRVRWWHGGPAGFKRGDQLLPPSQTGRVPGLDGTDKTSVYVTTSRDDALMFSARHERPALYEVTIDHEPVDDDVLPQTPTSKRVPSAKVWRIEQPSRTELAAVLQQMLRGDN